MTSGEATEPWHACCHTHTQLNADTSTHLCMLGWVRHEVDLAFKRQQKPLGSCQFDKLQLAPCALTTIHAHVLARTAQTCAHTYIHTCTPTNTHRHVHMHPYTCTHAHMRTHAHTQAAQSPSSWQ